MRQVALAGTRPNQQQADLRPESGPRSKGLSAEIVAKKIGKKKKQCQCCQMSAKCSIKILSRSIAKVLIWIRQNTLLSFKGTAARFDTPGPLQLRRTRRSRVRRSHKAKLFQPRSCPSSDYCFIIVAFLYTN